MKAKMTKVAVLVLFILVSMGCSSSPRVYYGVGKADGALIILKVNHFGL